MKPAIINHHRNFIFWFVAFCLVQAFLLIYCINGEAAEYTDVQIVDAIYRAEGGKKAQFPYGIRSIKCEGEAECRQICLNTVRNNRKRFAKQTKYTDFIAFLGSRYCPVGAENDPHGLNNHWVKNVRYFLNRS